MKYTGIKAAAGATKNLNGYYSGEYVELFVDKSSGKVWTVFHHSIGQQTWTEYHDDNIIKCGNISSPATMAEIKEMIENAFSMED
jgi:hypothetical protein